MKKIATLAFICCMASTFTSLAQLTENFDGATFSLTPNSFYQNTTTDDWQTSGSTPFATFRYHWDSGSGYWRSGSAFTNVKDSVNGTYTNIYGSITNAAFNGSTYVTVKDSAIIKMNSNALSLSGFFVTNTTFAYKTIKNGNGFSRKFGDTTGTHSGLPQGTYPDWFKLIVRPYRGGVLLTDSVEHYLADYRPAGTANDYIQKNWQYVFCANLPISDSIVITMRSSDTGTYGINTPAYFCMDNFTVVNTVGLHELQNIMNIAVFPNPTNDNLTLNYVAKTETTLSIAVYDVFGKESLTSQRVTTTGPNRLNLETAFLDAGIYFIELKEGGMSKKIKFVKLQP
jgi:hypothetical protein